MKSNWMDAGLHPFVIHTCTWVKNVETRMALMRMGFEGETRVNRIWLVHLRLKNEIA